MQQTILVGDIGSTKSTWWVAENVPVEIRLAGFNPLVHSVERGKEMFDALTRQLNGIIPDRIWYYGAGVIDKKISDSIAKSIHQHFPNTKCYVHSDLIGAAIGTCGKEPGTVAILGTGSHAAVFDGRQIIRQANALGYILGDEGGGCDIGKALLQAYFYDQMPGNVKKEMENFLPDGRSGFLHQLYTSSAPNQYLATFAEVAVKMKEDAWITELVKNRFRMFILNILLPLMPLEPVHFLGSIGCIFADLIENELAKNGLKAGIFLKDPSYRLFTMHSNHEIEEY